MKAHYLGINTTSTFPKWFIFFDTETWRKIINEKGDEKLTLRLGWVNTVHIDKNKKIISDEWKYFTTAKEFFNIVENFGGMKGEPIYLFAHNTAFDFSVLGGIKNIPERGHIIKRNMIADTVFLLDTWLDKGGKSLKHFVWLDSMNFARDSLKNIGKELGIPKTEPNGGKINELTGEREWSAAEWNKIKTEDMSKYCKNDVFVVRSFILTWLNFIDELELGSFCKTIAQQAITSYMREGVCPLAKGYGVEDPALKGMALTDPRFPELFKHIKPKGKIVVHTNKRAIALERQKKQGGRTEIFFKGKRTGTFYQPDFTSLYPFIMRNKALPYALITALVNPTIKEFKEVYIDKKKVVIIDADVYMKEPIIPVKTDKLRFKVGYVRVTATTPEIELLLKTGGKVRKVYAMNIYWAHTGLFKTWVDKLFKKRMEFKKEGKNVFQYMVKILLNSLSGKWGQESEEWEKVLDKEGKKSKIPLDALGWETISRTIRDKNGKDIGDEIVKVKKQLGFEWIKSKNKRLGFNTCLFLYDFITAYGRCMLYEAIRTAGRGNYFLSDTDSILVNKKGMKNLEKAGLINESEEKVLGMLESEDTFQYIEIRGLKDYTLVTVEGKEIVKTKGVRKDAVAIGKNVYRQKRFMKPASLINKGISEGVIVEIIKKDVSKSRDTYDKGVVGKNGFIDPLREAKKHEKTKSR